MLPKKRKDEVIKGVVVSGTKEFIESDNPERLEFMLFNRYRQIRFSKYSNGLYINEDGSLSALVEDREFLGCLIVLAGYLRPYTTTVCVKNEKGKYAIATEEEVKNILGLSDKKYRLFMKTMQENRLIKKQRFINGDYYHYEFMINPNYINYLLGRIGYSDFLVWREELIHLYSSSEIQYWTAKMSEKFAKACVDALEDGESAIHHKKLIRNLKNYTKPEWSGIRTPRRNTK